MGLNLLNQDVYDFSINKYEEKIIVFDSLLALIVETRNTNLL